MSSTAVSQFRLGPDLPEKASLHVNALMADAGEREIPHHLVMEAGVLDFTPLDHENPDLGFTSNHYWIKFSVENLSGSDAEYFFETARPLTDIVDLHIYRKGRFVRTLRSGDAIPAAQRDYPHRRSIFRLELPRGERTDFLLHLKSDGEVINLPLMLRSPLNLARITALEQFVFGIFYGIVALASIIYGFFFFGMRERTFLYYSLYVLFIGLLHFSLDGYFYQYFAPSGGWFSKRAVLIFATVAAFFLGRYSQIFLRIREHSAVVNRLFDATYVLLAMLMVYLLAAADISHGYPAANALGMIILLLIVTSVVLMYRKKARVDPFFTAGIFFLIAGFVIFILNNFGQIRTSFITQNGSKFGTGIEIVFLSLSMANLIARLRNEREALNRIALERAQEMNEMKSYFLSNISHELRTPLNAIMNLSSELKATVADENAGANLEIIRQSSQHLLGSINDILDFSKIEKGEIRLQPAVFDLAAMLEGIRRSAARQAGEKGLDFRFDIAGALPKRVLADEQRLCQVLNNVVSNALKFTAQGSVTVEIIPVISAQDLKLTMRVTDTGVGIDPQKMERIFGSFTQDSIDNKRKFGGLGLGLYIVRALVDLFGGQIAIKSEPGQGTACEMSMMLAIAALPEKSESDSLANPDLGGRAILVVEDNAINQMVIKMITKKWANATVDFTANGREALDALKSHAYDLVLMDLQMPVMDGYEATIAIRAGEAGALHAQIPIIAVTADVMESTRDRVREIGMDDYLTKPVKAEVLYEAVIKALERSGVRALAD